MLPSEAKTKEATKGSLFCFVFVCYVLIQLLFESKYYVIKVSRCSVVN
jgi:hypothetical protein